MYYETVDDLVGKVICNMANGLIILSGQKNSGRSSNLYGPSVKSTNVGLMQ